MKDGSFLPNDRLHKTYYTPDWQDCMDDHAAFLHQNRRYAACFDCITGELFAKAVAKAGYATDPDYAAKLIYIIEQHQLADLDGGA